MAHFAKLDENNVVIDVHGVHNNELLDENGNEQEARGVAFLIDWSGGYTNWKQTSYNGNFRKNYAGKNFTYDPDIDAFIPPQPYPSWVLNADARWQPPITMPTDGTMENPYRWNEATTSWIRD